MRSPRLAYFGANVMRENGFRPDDMRDRPLLEYPAYFGANVMGENGFGPDDIRELYRRIMPPLPPQVDTG